MASERIVIEGGHKFILTLNDKDEIIQIVCEDNVSIDYFLQKIIGNIDALTLGKKLREAIKLYNKNHN